MASQTRFLIIYETGGTWEMPFLLFLDYEQYINKATKLSDDEIYNLTSLEQWFATLPKEDQDKVLKQ